MMRLLFLVTLAVGVFLPAHAARLALVVGNDQYQHVTKLRNAAADAGAMAEAFRKAGYQVTLARDRDLKSLKDDLRAFRLRIQGGDEVIVFFSGHGVQFGGDNYLLPVDVRADTEEQVRDDALSLAQLLADLRISRPAFTLAIVDACRDNPFPKTGKAIGGRGLTRVDSATGQMVLYAAGEGQQALDRLGQNDPVNNGVFTRVFVKEMARPGIPVDQVLRNVRVEVHRLAQSVKHEQVPALYDQVLGTYYFYPPGSDTQISSVRPDPVPNIRPEQLEAEAWHATQRADTLAAYQAYLIQYPNGLNADTARTKVAALSPANSSGASAPALRADQDKGDFDKWMLCQSGSAATACSAYISAYPGGRYVDQASALLFAAGVDRIQRSPEQRKCRESGTAHVYVRPGDTLIRIGLEAGENWRDILRWNKMDNGANMEINQCLFVKQPSG